MKVVMIDCSCSSCRLRKGIGRVRNVYKAWGRRYILARAILPAQEAVVCRRSCTVFWSLVTRLLKLVERKWDEGAVNCMPRYVRMELGAHEKDVWLVISVLVLWSSPILSMLDLEKLILYSDALLNASKV